MKQKAQVGTLGMSSLSELLESLMEKEQAMQAQTKNKKMDNKMKQKLAYVAPSRVVAGRDVANLPTSSPARQV